MKKVIKLTEKDLTHIVKRVVNEQMDSTTAHNVYRKLKHEGETMDEYYRKLRNTREDLDGMVMQHLRRETVSDIFDYEKRTPSDVLENVSRLLRDINNLEYAISNYKTIIKRSISM